MEFQFKIEINNFPFRTHTQKVENFLVYEKIIQKRD